VQSVKSLSVGGTFCSILQGKRVGQMLRSGIVNFFFDFIPYNLLKV
jgi:hypothetical protein